ncbi:hypothetical protein ACIGD1_11210 [Streptomyces sp. NPDC085612]|uniref:hypothetical protein n=1 Tax=Streptomyces sp. NPDC085612 TaxID=3365732 RepID=UPI0037D544E1
MVTVHSPEPAFSGEVAGVRFSGGAADLDPAAAHAPAALAYFRRRGYRVTDVEPPVEEVGLEPIDDPETPAVGPGPDTGDGTADAFEPSEHTVAEVLAHLAAADDDERARVLAAEEAGQARATILKKGQPSE